MVAANVKLLKKFGWNAPGPSTHFVCSDQSFSASLQYKTRILTSCLLVLFAKLSSKKCAALLCYTFERLQLFEFFLLAHCKFHLHKLHKLNVLLVHNFLYQFSTTDIYAVNIGPVPISLLCRIKLVCNHGLQGIPRKLLAQIPPWFKPVNISLN